MRRLLACLSLLAPVSAAHAANTVWTGATNNNFSTTTNWNPAGNPAGSTLEFPADKTSALIQDIAGLSVSGLVFDSGTLSPDPYWQIDPPAATPSPSPMILGAGGISVSFTATTNSEISHPIQLGAAQTWSMAGDFNVNGPVDLHGFDLTVDATAQPYLQHHLTGTGNFIKQGTGGVTFTHPVNNDYNGTTTVNAGTLGFEKGDGFISIPGPLVVNSGSAFYQNNDQIADNSVVTLNGNSTLAMNGHSDTIGGLTGAGSLSLGAGGTLTVDGFGTLSGQLSGNAASVLTKTGAGTLTLSGSSAAWVGTLAVQSTVRVDGTIGAAVTVGAGGTLAGSGTSGAVTSTGGIVSPSSGGTAFTLHTGNLSLDGTSTFAPLLSSATKSDQLVVIGTVALGGTLNVSIGYVPAGGDRFTLIDNDGSDAVTGTFTGLAEGASFTAGTYNFRISYAGGDGNDVTIICTDGIGGPDLAVSDQPSDGGGGGGDLSMLPRDLAVPDGGAHGSSKGGGCSCDLTSGGGSAPFAGLALAVLLLLGARRRRA